MSTITPEQQEKVDAISRNPIPLEPINDSTQIAGIGHDPATNTLAVRFTPRAGGAQGSLYHYGNVDAQLFADFLNAESAGSFFYKNIRPRAEEFPYVKIEGETREQQPDQQAAAA